MIYDFVAESSKLLESEELLEDRMVKYNGELSPKFGWCVIYIGGPASGKGTATSYLSRLEGAYYNVDNLKEIKRMWDIKDPKTGRPHSDNFETPEEERDLGNDEFVSELHAEMKPLSKKWKKSILNNPENKKGRERLPNIIFDITGDELRKVMEIVNSVKEVGYKVAIIWILSTTEKALRNNLARKRKVEIDDVFVPKHSGVIEAAEDLFNSGEIEKVDEFWVIDAAVEVNPHVDPIKYHDEQNVYHIPTTKEGLKYFEEIASRIEYNKSELQRLIQKRKNLKK